MFIRNNLKYDQIICPSTNLIECMGIEIHCGNSKLIRINAYLPGASSVSAIRNFYQQDLLSLTNLRDAFFIVGDLNSKHVNWNCSTNNLSGNILENVSSNNNFFIEYPPTHTYCPMSIHFANSTIDLLLTNYKVPLSRIETKKIFASDHLPVLCEAATLIEYIRLERYNSGN